MKSYGTWPGKPASKTTKPAAPKAAPNPQQTIVRSKPAKSQAVAPDPLATVQPKDRAVAEAVVAMCRHAADGAAKKITAAETAAQNIVHRERMRRKEYDAGPFCAFQLAQRKVRGTDRKAQNRDDVDAMLRAAEGVLDVLSKRESA